MFCGRTLNRRINRLHERALRIAYEDYESSFEELLIKDDSVTIHQRNLRVLAVKMYKLSHKLSPEFMWDLVEEIKSIQNTKPGQAIILILMRMKRSSAQKSQTTVFKRQIQLRSDFSHLEVLDLRYGL